MQTEGIIRPIPGKSEFNRDAWCDLIDRRPELRRPASRSIINPFTKKPTTVHPPKDAAEVWQGNSVVGHVHWSMSDEPLINVSVEASARIFVDEWARELDGEFR